MCFTVCCLMFNILFCQVIVESGLCAYFSKLCIYLASLALLQICCTNIFHVFIPLFGIIIILVLLSFWYYYHFGIIIILVLLSFWYYYHFGIIIILVLLSFWYYYHFGIIIIFICILSNKMLLKSLSRLLC